MTAHDDVIKWKHFPRYWPFVRGIHRSPVNSPHKGQWRGALMFSLICVWTNGWVNNRDAGDLKRHRANCDVTVIIAAVIRGGGGGWWRCMWKLAAGYKNVTGQDDICIYIYIYTYVYMPLIHNISQSSLSVMTHRKFYQLGKIRNNAALFETSLMFQRHDEEF